MKSIRVLLASLALFILAAGTAQAESYVEGYLGNSFTLSSPNPLGFDLNPAFRGPTKVILEYPRNLSSSIELGAKVGTWFSKEGFPHFDYPDWAKYLGFYLDFNYRYIDYLPGVGSRRMTLIPSNYPFYQHYKFYGNGNIMTLGFMFSFRYGFHPTDKVPFGKLQPYLAVGPAIFITTLKPTFLLQERDTATTFFNNEYLIKGYDSFQSIVSVGLATELGLRYMITRFLSVDTSFKYHYTRPSAAYETKILGVSNELRFAPQINMISVQVGLAYHF